MNNRQERLLREYIRGNLDDRSPLNEGVKDVVKKALSAGLSRVKNLIATLEQFEPASLSIKSTLEKSGAGDFVSKVEVVGREFETSIEAVADSIPSGKNESRVLRSRRRNRSAITEVLAQRRALNEVALGGFEVVGLILAALGGVPLVLKGMYKLANLMGLKGVSEKLKVAYEHAHHFEEKFIDVIIPDKAMYAIYVSFEESRDPDAVANLKLYQDDPSSKLDGKRSMTLDEFKKSDVRKKYEKRVYALILLPWLISGLTSLHHAFHNWIGAIEGAATAEKAIFVGSRAAETAPVIASDIATAISSLAKAT